MNTPERVTFTLTARLLDLPTRAMSDAKLEGADKLETPEELAALEQSIVAAYASGRELLKRTRYALLARLESVSATRRAWAAHLLSCRPCDHAFDTGATVLGMLVNWRAGLCDTGRPIVAAVDAEALAETEKQAKQQGGAP